MTPSKKNTQEFANNFHQGIRDLYSFYCKANIFWDGHKTAAVSKEQVTRLSFFLCPHSCFALLTDNFS